MMQKKLYVNKEKPISFGYVKFVTTFKLVLIRMSN
jgi:hypothetical protein